MTRTPRDRRRPEGHRSCAGCHLSPAGCVAWGEGLSLLCPAVPFGGVSLTEKVTGTIVRGMETREIIRRRRRRFWSLALLWLPTGVMATAVVRFLPGTGEAQPPSMWGMAILMAVPSLVFVAPCGLPLALGCQRLWRLGFRRAAWVAGIWLGAVTVAASLVAGLLGPIAIALYAVVLSLPVWIAWWWLARRS